MARSTITATTVPAISSNGYNLTDSSDFTVMSTGSNNGVTFVFNASNTIVLKNTTGGAAVYTLILASFGQITGVGGSTTDPTVTVAAGKTHVFKPPAVFQLADGNMDIDCDVAGSILVLDT